MKDVKKGFTRPATVVGPDAFRDVVPEARVVPDTPDLALEPGAHDLVLHLLGLHWADDPVGQLIQSRLALEPDGFFLAATFGGGTLSELRSALAMAESQLSGGLSPRVAPMADIRDLGGLLQRAGFALSVADVRRLDVTYPDLATLVRDLRSMGETSALADRSRRPAPRALFSQAEDVYRRHFSRDGGLAATFEIVFLSGWSPGPNQPQPLRPGSARARLADALSVPEHPLPRKG